MSSSRRNFIQKLAMGTLAGISLADSRWVYAAGMDRAKEPSHGPIRLDQNGNAYGAFPSVIEALQSNLGRLNLYPDTERMRLTELIARTHSVDPEQVVLGCGSTEILRAAANAFVGPGKKMVCAVPTFPAIADYAKACGSAVVTVPLNKYFEHDLQGMRAKIDAATSLVYICNPNNPTGTLTPRKAVESFLAGIPARVHAIIDEAYHEFVETSGAYSSFIEHPVNRPHTTVVRSFSKMFALAGLRVGYAITDRDSAMRLRQRLTRQDVNALGAIAAIAALNDHQALKDAFQRNIDDSQEFINEATGRRLKPIISHTNFMTFDTTTAAPPVVEHFKKHNILIAGPFPGLDRYVRVLFAKSDEMLEFWRVWDLLGIHPQGGHH